MRLGQRRGTCRRRIRSTLLFRVCRYRMVWADRTSGLMEPRYLGRPAGGAWLSGHLSVRGSAADRARPSLPGGWVKSGRATVRSSASLRLPADRGGHHGPRFRRRGVLLSRPANAVGGSLQREPGQTRSPNGRRRHRTDRKARRQRSLPVRLRTAVSVAVAGRAAGTTTATATTT